MNLFFTFDHCETGKFNDTRTDTDTINMKVLRL